MKLLSHRRITFLNNKQRVACAPPKLIYYFFTCWSLFCVFFFACFELTECRVSRPVETDISECTLTWRNKIVGANDLLPITKDVVFERKSATCVLEEIQTLEDKIVEITGNLVCIFRFSVVVVVVLSLLLSLSL